MSEIIAYRHEEIGFASTAVPWLHETDLRPGMVDFLFFRRARLCAGVGAPTTATFTGPPRPPPE
jgi:hypothetical protein